MSRLSVDSFEIEQPMREEDEYYADLIGVEEQSCDRECRRCHKLYPVNIGDIQTEYCAQCARELLLNDEDHL